uniref:Uncharacterized protein n=1 Tax=Tanacetum cinerariifolium TaxID=118510 RepID=A0A6L2LJC2_TANCI|nr:hypothetical protein [Tanacetum cinerariifolium]
MSGSELSEMAPESSQVIVLPKFDMHIHTSVLTTEELKDAITEYCIPMDLHPCLPHRDLTMNKLPPRILFEIRFRSLDINATVSLFWVFYKTCKQGHWFSFENKIGGRAKKCFKEKDNKNSFGKEESSKKNEKERKKENDCETEKTEEPQKTGRHLDQKVLKGWKKKFFLIDRRAILDAMPWRRINTDLSDDFPTHYNEDNDNHLAEFVVPLRPPPRPLLYVVEWNICEQRGSLDSQRLPLRTTLPLEAGKLIPKKSPAQMNLEKPNFKIDMAREKKDQQNLAKAQAKRAGGGSVAPCKKKVRQNQEPVGSRSERTLSPTPLHHVASRNTDKTAIVVLNVTAGNTINVEKEVVDLSAHLFNSTHHEDTEEDVVDRQFVPHWEFVMTFVFVERIKSLEEILEPKSRQLADVEKRVKVLEGEKAALVAELTQANMDLYRLVREFIPTVVRKPHTSVEYRKSLRSWTWISRVRRRMKPSTVSPDVPPSIVDDGIGPSTTNNDDGTATKTPSNDCDCYQFSS